MKGREKRLMYHRDLGIDFFEAPINLNDFIWDFIGRIAGTQIDTFVLHITYHHYPSKLKVEEYVSEQKGGPVGRIGNHATWVRKGELTATSWRILESRQKLIDMDIDPVKVLIDATHEAGIDFFAGIRMNDVHHAQYDWHPKFWLEHPEFRIGDHPEYRHPRAGFREPGGKFQSRIDGRVPAALDYIHDEVRAHKLATIEEVARAYNVEGIELDFTRHPFYFKPHEVDLGRQKMTEFVATVRKRLNEIDDSGGRRVILEVRVPPTMKACWRIGLNIRNWIHDELVDIVTVAPLWHPDFNMPVEAFIEAADGTNCKIFASFEFAEMPILEDSVKTAEVIRAAALAYWKAGVDGINLFNMHLFPYYFRQKMPFLREVGDQKLLEYLDKHYMVTRASNYDHLVWFSYPKQLPTTLRESPSGSGQKIHFNVGDNVEKASRLGLTVDVVLRLRIINLTSEDKVELKFNGIKLPGAYKSAFFPVGESGALRQYPFIADLYFGLEGPYHWLEFRLEKETLPRIGMNEVEVVLKERNPKVTEELILNDVEMTIKYRK